MTVNSVMQEDMSLKVRLPKILGGSQVIGDDAGAEIAEGYGGDIAEALFGCALRSRARRKRRCVEAMPEVAAEAAEGLEALETFETLATVARSCIGGPVKLALCTTLAGAIGGLTAAGVVNEDARKGIFAAAGAVNDMQLRAAIPSYGIANGLADMFPALGKARDTVDAAAAVPLNALAKLISERLDNAARDGLQNGLELPGHPGSNMPRLQISIGDDSGSVLPAELQQAVQRATLPLTVTQTRVLPLGPEWNDGTLCALGTTCNQCKNKATYWPSKVSTRCGNAPCWGRGTVCGGGTTCNSCCNGSEGKWYWFGVQKCK